PAIDDGEGEHAGQAVEDAISPSLVPPKEHFRVGVRAERHTLGRELAPDVEKVVDLAVVRYADGLRLVPHRLMAGDREVDDRQTRGSETDARLEHHVEAAVVGSAVMDRPEHLGQDTLV